MSNLDKYCSVKFYRNTGKITQTLEGDTFEVLKNYISNNFNYKKLDALIFRISDGAVLYYIEGHGENSIEINEDLGNIDDYCPGLIDAVREL